VPEKIDRFLGFEALGVNGFGFESLVDMRTSEHVRLLRREFI